MSAFERRTTPASVLLAALLLCGCAAVPQAADAALEPRANEAAKERPVPDLVSRDHFLPLVEHFHLGGEAWFLSSTREPFGAGDRETYARTVWNLGRTGIGGRDRCHVLSVMPTATAEASIPREKLYARTDPATGVFEIVDEELGSTSPDEPAAFGRRLDGDLIVIADHPRWLKPASAETLALDRARWKAIEAVIGDRWDVEMRIAVQWRSEDSDEFLALIVDWKYLGRLEVRDPRAQRPEARLKVGRRPPDRKEGKFHVWEMTYGESDEFEVYAELMQCFGMEVRICGLDREARRTGVDAAG